MGQREDDISSGGSELITHCSGLIHKSIVANELAVKTEPARGVSLTASVALRLLMLHLKRRIKMFLSGCFSPGSKNWNEYNEVGEKNSTVKK